MKLRHAADFRRCAIPKPKKLSLTHIGFTHYGSMNITLSIEDDLVKEVRKIAVERSNPVGRFQCGAGIFRRRCDESIQLDWTSHQPFPCYNR